MLRGRGGEGRNKRETHQKKGTHHEKCHQRYQAIQEVRERPRRQIPPASGGAAVFIWVLLDRSCCERTQHLANQTSSPVREGEAARQRVSERASEGGRMEGEDRGRQQVVVMHKATFLAALMGNGGPGATFAMRAIREECAFVKMLTKAGVPYPPA